MIIIEYRYLTRERSIDIIKYNIKSALDHLNRNVLRHKLVFDNLRNDAFVWKWTRRRDA